MIRAQKHEDSLAVNALINPKIQINHLMFFVPEFPHQKSSDTFKPFISFSGQELPSFLGPLHIK